MEFINSPYFVILIILIVVVNFIKHIRETNRLYKVTTKQILKFIFRK